MNPKKVYGAILVACGLGALAILARAGVAQEKPPIVEVKPVGEFFKIGTTFVRKDQIAAVEVPELPGSGPTVFVYLVGKERPIGCSPGEDEESRTFFKALGLPPVEPEAKR